MGYACPVCEDPQADGEHLANHLAFTAMLGDEDHETWLDEHVPDWGDTDPPELANAVTDHAAETEFPQVFEDTTDGAGHDGHGHVHDSLAGGDDTRPGDVSDPADLFDDDASGRDVDDVVADARELTRQQWANVAAGDDEGGDDEGGDGASDDDAVTADDVADGDDTASE